MLAESQTGTADLLTMTGAGHQGAVHPKAAKRILIKGDAEVSEGVYFLNAAPLDLSGADGSPCRAVLIATER